MKRDQKSSGELFFNRKRQHQSLNYPRPMKSKSLLFVICESYEIRNCLMGTGTGWSLTHWAIPSSSLSEKYAAPNNPARPRSPFFLFFFFLFLLARRPQTRQSRPATPPRSLSMQIFLPFFIVAPAKGGQRLACTGPPPHRISLPSKCHSRTPPNSAQRTSRSRRSQDVPALLVLLRVSVPRRIAGNP
jgi:hypothetical protein